MFKATKNDKTTYTVFKDNEIIAHCFNKYGCVKAVWVHSGSKEDEYYSFINDTDIVNVGVKDD